MAARAMISPVVFPATNSQAAKAEQYCTNGSVSRLAIAENGVVLVPWALTFGRAPDWTPADADPEIETLFPIPGSVNTFAELKAFLRAATVSQLNAGQIANLQAIFDAHGINRADFSGTTTGAQVIKRVLAALFEADFFEGWEFG